jgi:hypothetical protein
MTQFAEVNQSGLLHLPLLYEFPRVKASGKIGVILVEKDGPNYPTPGACT